MYTAHASLRTATAYGRRHGNADALNAYHNGTRFKGENEDKLDPVPKNVVQNIWFYGASDPLHRAGEKGPSVRRPQIPTKEC